MTWPFKKPEHTATFQLQPFNPENGTIEIGMCEDGTATRLNFTNVSGVVVGGIPGSGKTAGMELLALCFRLAGCNVHIVDGKGGSDWKWFKPFASGFVTDDLDAVKEAMLKLNTECMRRLASMTDIYGESNYWNLSPDQRPPLEVIFVDECQTFFDPDSLVDKTDKEEKDKAATITKAATNIVKKGRGAGYILIAITQKPTVNSLPSSLRDNCGLCICFSVSRPEAARAVLGPLPDDAPSPLSIPKSRCGGAVIGLDTGELVMCRFAYVTKKNATAALIAKKMGVL